MSSKLPFDHAHGQVPAFPKVNLQELKSRLMAVQDQERRKIARDLHDCMGGNLSILKMNLDRLASAPNLTSEQVEVLSQSVSLAETVLREVRTIAYLLHPPLLDEVGLVAALRSLADGFSQRSGIQATLDIKEKFIPLISEIEISIYRIVQECLTNVHRHSGSLTARIRVQQHPAEVLIEVQDDGHGMATGQLSTASSVGLGGMRERTARLHGTLDIASGPTGTTVVARIPWSNELLASGATAGGKSAAR